MGADEKKRDKVRDSEEERQEGGGVGGRREVLCELEERVTEMSII